MGVTKFKGDMAEAAIAYSAVSRGYTVSIPFGEDAPYDLVLDYGDGCSPLQRCQIKFLISDGTKIVIPCKAVSHTKGRTSVRKYTKVEIDWLIAWEMGSEIPYSIPAEILGDGMSEITLRFTRPKNGQDKGIRWAESFAGLPSPVGYKNILGL